MTSKRSPHKVFSSSVPTASEPGSPNPHLQIQQQLYRLLLTSHSLEEIAQIALEGLASLVSFDSGSISLVEPGTREPRTLASIPTGPEPNPTFEIPIPPQVLDVLETGKPDWGMEVQEEGGPAGIQFLPVSHGMQSRAYFPLIARSQLIGVLHLNSKKPDPVFRTQQALIEEIAGALAVSLENVRLHTAARRQVDELQALHAVSSAVNEVNSVDELIEKATRIVGEQLFPTNFGVFVFNPQQLLLTPHPSYRESVGIHSFAVPLGAGVTGHVAETQTPLCLGDVSTFSKYISSDPEVRSELCVPLFAGKGLFGVLNTESKEANRFTHADQRLLETVAAQLGLGIEKVRLRQEEESQRQFAETLRELTTTLASTLEIEKILQIILQYMRTVLPNDSVAVMLIEGDQLRIVADSGFRDEIQRANLPINRLAHVQNVVQNRIAVQIQDTQTDPRWVKMPGSEYIRSWLGVPLIVKDAVLGLLSLDSETPGTFHPQAAERARAFANQAALALENARLFQASQQRIRRLDALSAVSNYLNTTQLTPELLHKILFESLNAVDLKAGWIFLKHKNHIKLAAQHGLAAAGGLQQMAQQGEWCSCQQHLELTELETGVQQRECALLLETRPWMAGSPAKPLPWHYSVAIRSESEVFGVLNLAGEPGHLLSPDDHAVLTSISHQLAVALERSRLFTVTERRLQQLQALHTIDTTITASFDLRVTLNVLLGQVITQLGVDAADILLVNQPTLTLEYMAGSGFVTGELYQAANVGLNDGYAGRAVLENRVVGFAAPEEDQDKGHAFPLLREEGFQAYYAAPLVTKGRAQGVLEVFSRQPLLPDQEWYDFFQALADLAAIAVDDARMISELQLAHFDLVQAYDSTLEGWVRALDLRDKETEGHSKRVTEKTIQLARRLGVGEEALVHIRRGALLHDIGKIAIPDRILQKPGPLNEDEWRVLRKHPVYAFELLYPIEYLRPALDIPYCHHERWDGTGYPRGLQGEQIPLAARIFAVVDVWDALCSDRPYRPAWPHEKVLEYLAKQAGTHFDPHILARFLESQ